SYTSQQPVGVTKTVPHVVGGGGYTSIIEVINTGSVTAGVSASFFNQNGSPSTLNYSTNLAGTISTFSGSMSSPVSVPPGGNLVITLPNTGSSTVVNWGTITSTSSAGSCAGLCNTITVGEVFEFRDSSNRLLSRVGVPATVPNMTSFVIPRFRN